MYAIVQQGGHQFRVSPGDRLVVDRLEAEVGTVVALEPVLLVHDGSEATVGTPVIEGARVAATVIGHTKGRKIRVFKYKAKKRYRRTHGHRSHLTELLVDAVVGAGEALPAARPPKAEKALKGERTAAAVDAPTTEKAPTPATVSRPAARKAAAKAAPIEADDVAVAPAPRPRRSAAPKSATADDSPAAATDAATDEE